MPMSDYLESILLNQVLNGAAYSQPSTVYVALYTVAPTDAGGGTEVSQGSGGLNYVRQSMTGGSAWTVTGTATRANNTAAITFPVAGDTWGTVVAVEETQVVATQFQVVSFCLDVAWIHCGPHCHDSFVGPLVVVGVSLHFLEFEVSGRHGLGWLLNDQRGRTQVVATQLQGVSFCVRKLVLSSFEGEKSRRFSPNLRQR